MPIENFRFDPKSSKDYFVKANWALYCDNYLEGFHIPFVHGGLNQALDYDKYSTEIQPYSVLQLGYADKRSLSFNLPKSSKDHGRKIAAYYFWLFPSTSRSIHSIQSHKCYLPLNQTYNLSYIF